MLQGKRAILLRGYHAELLVQLVDLHHTRKGLGCVELHLDGHVALTQRAVHALVHIPWLPVVFGAHVETLALKRGDAFQNLAGVIGGRELDRVAQRVAYARIARLSDLALDGLQALLTELQLLELPAQRPCALLNGFGNAGLQGFGGVKRARSTCPRRAPT